MLVELLRPMGPELARRWLAALTLAPEHEREAIVESIERRMAELYAPEGRSKRAVEPAEEARPTRQVRVVLPPRERGGMSEQLIRTYEVREGAADRSGKGKRKSQGA